MRIGVTILFAAVSVFGQTTTPGTQTSTSSLPPVGLASTETVQVNVANTASLSPAGVISYCTGSIAFFDASGNAIGSPTNFNLANGQISSVKLAFSSIPSAGSLRAVVRATVSLTYNSTVAIAPTNGVVALPPPCALATSLETYDTATGATHVYYVSPGPQIIPLLRGLVSANSPTR